MNKYHNGKIYKIVDVGYNKCYIGSTTETLSRRMAHHKCSFKHYKQGLRTKVSSFELPLGHSKICYIAVLKPIRKRVKTIFSGRIVFLKYY